MKILNKNGLPYFMHVVTLWCGYFNDLTLFNPLHNFSEFHI